MKVYLLFCVFAIAVTCYAESRNLEYENEKNLQDSLNYAYARLGREDYSSKHNLLNSENNNLRQRNSNHLVSKDSNLLQNNLLRERNSYNLNLLNSERNNVLRNSDNLNYLLNYEDNTFLRNSLRNVEGNSNNLYLLRSDVLNSGTDGSLGPVTLLSSYLRSQDFPDYAGNLEYVGYPNYATNNNLLTVNPNDNSYTSSPDVIATPQTESRIAPASRGPRYRYGGGGYGGLGGGAGAGIKGSISGGIGINAGIGASIGAGAGAHGYGYGGGGGGGYGYPYGK